MTTPAQIAHRHASIAPAALEHLQRLLGSWSLLADLSFSDLLLLVPLSADHETAGGPHLVVLGQMRPNNRPTLVEQDLVGLVVKESSWKLTAQALRSGSIIRGFVRLPSSRSVVPVEEVPVRFRGEVIAVIARISQAPSPEAASEYERAYLSVFDRLVGMVTQGAFPFPTEDVGAEETPRVGDGVVVIDASGDVEFASPNAMNAFHRLGVYSPPEGRSFVELGITSAVTRALESGRPVLEEVERRPDVVVLVQCIPLLSGDRVTGAMILLRDVTDVRKLDRLLLSKDAAIREVHHRVKNNLQTISSLLRLQGRRLAVGAGREALNEAERRVRSIALVHEILSREPGDQVPFDEIVESLVQMARDSVVSTHPVEITVHGSLGEVEADLATPLAVALAEILQNAVEHAFDERRVHDLATSGGGERRATMRLSRVGSVAVDLQQDEKALSVTVRDDGVGLPPGFDLRRSTSLGLSIVRDLVSSQLNGSIEMSNVPPAQGRGTLVRIEVPLRG